jgi:hypothetical protein
MAPPAHSSANSPSEPTPSEPTPSITGDDWLTAVDRYFDQLTEALDQLNFCAASFVEKTGAGDFEGLAETNQHLLTAAQQLEALLNVRLQILQAATEQGGSRPRSLRAALRARGEHARGALAEELARRVDEVRGKAVTLFVTQFNLFETTDEILRKLLRQAPDPGGYGKQYKPPGGGLLDGAA